jgi:tetratricopeptide (TPR) repeat protein
MTDIFLSYVREDEGRARKLAALLERDGRSVWWDRRIKGGARYAREIENALAAAEFVVVLWSAASIQSAWVADEAAAGRDRGCLVPLSLDGTQPPLGFRQFQTIDLLGWSGRGTPPNWEALKEALKSAQPDPASSAKGLKQGLRRQAPVWVLGGIGAAVVAAAAGAYFLLSREDATSVAIRPAVQNEASIAAAADLGTRLGSMAAIDTSLFRLTSSPAAAGTSALLVQVRAADDSQKSSRDVNLVSGSDGGILWAAHFEQPKDRASDLVPQVSAATGRVLSCAADSLAGRFPRLPLASMKLYLAGCARLAEQSDETLTDLAPVFQQIVTSQPRFAPAWDKLLQIEAAAVMDGPHSPFLSPLKQHLRRARELAVDAPGVYAAEAALRPSNDFLGRIEDLQRGIDRFPQSSELHSILAGILMCVGRQEDALEQARAARDLDPLSPIARGDFIFDLAHSGRLEQAKQELAAAEEVWPDTSALRWVRFSLELRYGDPKVALNLIHEGVTRASSKSTEALLAARIEPTPANVDVAIAHAREVNRQTPFWVTGLATTLATFGKTDEALAVLLKFDRPAYAGYQSEPLFRPTMRQVRRDPRFMQAMAKMSLLTVWSKSGHWPDFCFEPDLPYDCRKEAAKYLQ